MEKNSRKKREGGGEREGDKDRRIRKKYDV